jgi:hypothetical protein
MLRPTFLQPALRLSPSYTSCLSERRTKRAYMHSNAFHEHETPHETSTAGESSVTGSEDEPSLRDLMQKLGQGLESVRQEVHSVRQEVHSVRQELHQGLASLGQDTRQQLGGIWGALVRAVPPADRSLIVATTLGQVAKMCGLPHGDSEMRRLAEALAHEVRPLQAAPPSAGYGCRLPASLPEKSFDVAGLAAL